MVLGAGVWELLLGTFGSVLVVSAVLLSSRWGFRRSVGIAGAGLLLLGLSVSGIVGIVAQAVAVGLNPVRWLGLAAAAVGVLMLSWAGMLRGRRHGRDAVSGRDEHRQVDRARAVPPTKQPVDDDLAEIEDILRRRGIE